MKHEPNGSIRRGSAITRIQEERHPAGGSLSLLDNNAEGGKPADGFTGEEAAVKTCTHCGRSLPLSEFKRRSGRRSGRTGRRGACRTCRQLLTAQGEAAENRDGTAQEPGMLLKAAAGIERSSDPASDKAKAKNGVKRKEKAAPTGMDGEARPGMKGEAEGAEPAGKEDAVPSPPNGEAGEAAPGKKTGRSRSSSRRRKRRTVASGKHEFDAALPEAEPLWRPVGRRTAVGRHSRAVRVTVGPSRLRRNWAAKKR
ncbi:hypothetical protein N6H14_15195 [Paenibacillus sp. CC-CFT747]|nr:hypothetical protein N6H14_15195 [Paenibacillus sp. CC-CFT747]